MTPEAEAAKVADWVNQQLRDAGFPETAIQSWWMLLRDPQIDQTPYRVWESRDFFTLNDLLEKTLREPSSYRSRLERVTSQHWAERLAQSQEVQSRLLGGLAL